MSHKRTIIRHYFRDYLKANVASVSDRVYSGRIDPLDEKDQTTFPYITISSKDEDVNEADGFVGVGYTVREFDLMVGLVIRDNQTQDSDFDELVEDLLLEVETAMSKVPYQNIDGSSYRLFDSITLEKTQTMTNNQSGSDIGANMMTYRVKYEYENPIVAVEMVDFDLASSIANIKITNAGVPNND